MTSFSDSVVRSWPAQVFHRDARPGAGPPARRFRRHKVPGPPLVPGLHPLPGGHACWRGDRGGCQERGRGPVLGGVRLHAGERGGWAAPDSARTYVMYVCLLLGVRASAVLRRVLPAVLYLFTTTNTRGA